MTSKNKEGIVHIFASPNNTLMLLTDVTGSETIGKCTGGQITKAQHKEGEPYTAMKIAEKIADLAREKEISEVIVKVRATGGIRTKTPGKGSEAAIRSLTRNGLRIKSIENVTPVPHDGCRRKKKFRARKK